jgi:uroporphyrin-III C-methyltransferase
MILDAGHEGKVYLVGAGPGDPELLTIKALRLLESAEVILHDDLVSQAILERASPAAQILNVGKRCGRKIFSQEEINQLAVSYARDGYTVLRLQSGDPLIFGRTAEEMAALREAGVEFEIVPGVTSALGAAAAAKIALTERGVSSAVVFATGHHWDGQRFRLLPGMSGPGVTMVVYMPTDYVSISEQLRAAGWDSETPCLVVSNASTPCETCFLTTLSELPQAPQLPAPTLLILGAVAKTAVGNEAHGAGDVAELVSAHLPPSRS